MNDERYRALVIDDDYAVRNLTCRALRAEGFACDAAADGLQGSEILDSCHYDVVVTDLRMPGKNGHAIACELLAREDRPVVVVLTGVLEPKLATDLVTRGVDYVEFKPVRFELFAAKVKGLMQRGDGRPSANGSNREAPAPRKDDVPLSVDGAKTGDNSQPPIDLRPKLAKLGKILPIPQAALDVYTLTSSEKCDTQQIGACIARNASLSLDVLRLANTSYYNPSGSKVLKLDDAVLRIGHRRIGELALATGMMAAITANSLPWMDMELVWRRSMAAGVAIDVLLDGNHNTEVEEGLFLGAIMHPLGRIALGSIAPQEYDEMLRIFEKSGVTLAEQEETRFGTSAGHAISNLLAEWKLSPAIYEPLQFITDSYASLASKLEPLRTKAEMLRLAVLIGQMAIGEWKPWERLEFPPEPTLRRLHIGYMLAEIIRNVRVQTLDIVNFHPRNGNAKAQVGDDHGPASINLEMTYCNLSPEPFDFLASIVTLMGIDLQPASPKSLPSRRNVLINCIRAQPDALRALGRGSLNDGKQVVVTDFHNLEHCAPFGEVVALPCSYRTLRTACREAASASST